MSGQNPHPGDMHHSQIPVSCPTPPPPLRLDVDRCITMDLPLYMLFHLPYILWNHNNSKILLHFFNYLLYEAWSFSLSQRAQHPV